MLRIPDFYKINMSYDESSKIIRGLSGQLGKCSLIEGMRTVERIWIDYCSSDDQEDNEFFSRWIYEINAYNTVYENLDKLLSPAT